MAIFIFTVDMLHFFLALTRSLGCTCYAAMRQSIKIPFFVWFLRFLHTDILHKLTRKKRGGGGGGGFKEHFEKITQQSTCSQSGVECSGRRMGDWFPRISLL